MAKWLKGSTMAKKSQVQFPIPQQDFLTPFSEDPPYKIPVHLLYRINVSDSGSVSRIAKHCPPKEQEKLPLWLLSVHKAIRDQLQGTFVPNFVPKERDTISQEKRTTLQGPMEPTFLPNTAIKDRG